MSLTQSWLNVFYLLLLWQALTTAGQLLSVSLSTSKQHRAEGNLMLCLFFHHHETSLPQREACRFMRVKLWTLSHRSTNTCTRAHERVCFTVLALPYFVCLASSTHAMKCCRKFSHQRHSWKGIHGVFPQIIYISSCQSNFMSETSIYSVADISTDICMLTS